MLQKISAPFQMTKRAAVKLKSLPASLIRTQPTAPESPAAVGRQLPRQVTILSPLPKLQLPQKYCPFSVKSVA